MKATNKQEFFDLLGIELNRIGIEDTKDIFADFEEHFADGAMQGIPEDVTAERLGDIKEIARSYLNLESSRINSIMARDVERRRVSLTKPGRGVPADLSLIGNGSAKDAVNSDNIREYTPQHFSSEIYPQSSNTNRVYGNSGNTASGAANTGGAASAAGTGTYSGMYSGGNSTYSRNNTNNTSAGGSAEKTVADAFSDAGRAALDAAKITGQAVADAFKQSGVKEAVIGAGKTAADAVKAAGHTAAEAVQRAAKPRGKKKKQSAAYNGAVPKPSDTYRENMNTTNNASGSRTAEMPRQNKKVKGNGGYKLISVAELKPNVNAGKLILAILLDCLLWSWVLPAAIGITFGLVLGNGAFGFVGEGFSLIFGGKFTPYAFISRLFLGFGYLWLGVAAVCVAVFFIQLIIKLVKFIINLHIKAIYDL